MSQITIAQNLITSSKKKTLSNNLQVSHVFTSFWRRKIFKIVFVKVLLENQVFEIFFLGQQMTNHMVTSLDQSICTDKGIIFIQFI